MANSEGLRMDGNGSNWESWLQFWKCDVWRNQKG